MSHYRCVHRNIFTELQRLDASNATSEQILNFISRAHKVHENKKSASSITSYFATKQPNADLPVAASVIGARGGNSGGASSVSLPEPPEKLRQIFATILYSCYTETPISRIGTPELQGFVDVFGGRVKFMSKYPIDSHMVETYEAVCNLLKTSTTIATTGCMTFDGWSSAQHAPILGVTWHYIDATWKLQCIPVASVNIGDASKSSNQLCAILEDVVKHNMIIGSDNISIHTVTTDNESATALAADLMTNFVGSVRCVVHTIALVVNDVFTADSNWQKYLDIVNETTTFFNHHPKELMFLRKLQVKSGVTQDRIMTLKQSISTQWHSRLAAMLSYLTLYDEIMTVANKNGITSSKIQRLSVDQRNTLGEYISVLSEVRRVARQLEADRKVTMSRTPRLLRELFETLLIMAGDMIKNDTPYYEKSGVLSLDESDMQADSSHATIGGIAISDKDRDEARGVLLVKPQAKQLARALAAALEKRLGHIWKQVDEASALWHPSEFSDVNEPAPQIRESRRTLLFHIAAILDINECQLEAIEPYPLPMDDYMSLLYRAVVREAQELDGSLKKMGANLEVLFSMFHKEMLSELEKNGRKHPSYALRFWAQKNASPSLISPVPFNGVAKACLASQASSASAERLFSDLGKIENNQSQSLMSSSLEMTEIIRVFVANELDSLENSQIGLMHPRASAFRALVNQVSKEVFRLQ